MGKKPHKISVGYPLIGMEEYRAVTSAIRQKRLSAGKNVKDFEEMYAKRLGRRYGIAVNSGSSANLISIFAMKEKFGWKDGNSFFVPALTFPTAVAPIIQAGFRPIFVDVDEDGNMSYSALLKAHRETARPKNIIGLVLVHSLGVPARDTKKIITFCKKNGLEVLEDACESHGAAIENKEVGSFGFISTTSFFVAHNMTTGEGGMVFTDDPQTWTILRSLREFGRRIDDQAQQRWLDHGGNLGHYDLRYCFDRLGFNVRMTDLAAAIGIEQLKKLDQMNQRRRALVSIITKGLSPLTKRGLVVFSSSKGRYNTYYAFQFRVKDKQIRKELAATLESNGVETRPFMGGNLLKQKAFEKYGAHEKFPKATELHETSLFVGCHPTLTHNDAKKIVSIIKNWFRKNGAPRASP